MVDFYVVKFELNSINKTNIYKIKLECKGLKNQLISLLVIVEKGRRRDYGIDSAVISSVKSTPVI